MPLKVIRLIYNFFLKLESFIPRISFIPIFISDDISWYINSKFLPSKQFPMVFISVQGKSERSIEQSWYNNKEIEEIINVIKRLLPPKAAKEGLRSITQSDIGVVTPYRKQRFKLSQRLRYLNFDEVTVGTAEVFQGKERPVMIISTVRSDGELGFVADPRVSTEYSEKMFLLNLPFFFSF